MPEKNQINKDKSRRIIRRPEVLSRTGLSDVTIWRMEKAHQFPKRVKLGGNSVGWFDDELDRWFDAKDRERFIDSGEAVNG